MDRSKGGDLYRPGDWLTRCDRSGETCYASETVLEPSGMRVKREYADKRHPQEGRRAPPPDRQVPPWTRPPGPDVFVGTNEVQAEDL